MTANADITLSEAVAQATRFALENINTAMPGSIVKYDFTTQKADVQPLLNRRVKDSFIKMPIIVDVPVIFPAGGGASLTFPVKVGDTVLLLFSERSIELWLSLGGEVSDEDKRKFDLSDAIAIPGLSPFNVTSKAENNDDVLLVSGNAKITLKKNGDCEIDADNPTSTAKIKLGSGSLKKLVNDSFQTLFNNHVHNISVAGTPAAQLGISSSPAQVTGSGSVNIPAVPTPTLHLFPDDLSTGELTSKVEAE